MTGVAVRWSHVGFQVILAFLSAVPQPGHDEISYESDC